MFIFPMSDQPIMTEDEGVMTSAEWGIRPRRLLVALQYLQVFQETKDKEYLTKCLREVLEVSIDEDFIEYKGMADSITSEIHLFAMRLLQDPDEDVAGLQGMMEGLHIRILFDTHPHKLTG